MNVPRIVVLDGHALNPGDLSWKPLEALGEFILYDRTPRQEVVSRCLGAQIVFTNKTALTAETFSQLTSLRYIGVLATGFNVVEVTAARALGIPVTNVPAYGTMSVAQHVFALLLELTSRTGHHARTVQEGRWSQGTEWCYWDGPMTELAGLTLGIIGAGRIGRAVGTIAEAFGMKVQYAGRSDGRLGLERTLSTSDVISLHCPLTEETRGLIGPSTLALMKPTALLINTSRGPLIDEAALSEALNAGQLAGAGLDVLSTEPPPANNPLLHARHCIITPHLAWGTTAARTRLLEIATANLVAFLSGRPQNVVN